MKLLLFDIDGTLLISRGAGRRAMQDSVRRIIGRKNVAINGVDFSGRTDPEILKDVYLQNGLPEVEWERHVHEAIAAYIEAFRDSYDVNHFVALPGVLKLVEQLNEISDVQLALLTGNLEITAYLKLKAIGLDQYFPFGAFSSDDSDRYKLPGVAIQRAYEYTGRNYAGKNVVIIGDTRHDILCGRDLNVFSVAVSTGHFSADELHAHGPDALFEDLSDTDAFITRII